MPAHNVLPSAHSSGLRDFWQVCLTCVEQLDVLCVHCPSVQRQMFCVLYHTGKLSISNLALQN